MLFKYGHKMRLTVPHELGQLFNSKRLDIMLIDVINDFPNFFIFTIMIIRSLSLYQTIVVEKVDEFLRFGLKQNPVVSLFLSNDLKNCK